MTEQRVKYFAYGSNMDIDQMKQRCPSAEVLGSGVLRDYALGFTVYSQGWDGGAADVVHGPGQEVWGIVYVFGIQDLDGLDTDEGYPDQYRRVQLPVEVDGTQHPGVWVYEVVRKLSFVPPKCKYIELMRNAAVRYGFPRKYLESLSAVKCVQ
jgi:gamma-glutamylcyclotransferase